MTGRLRRIGSRQCLEDTIGLMNHRMCDDLDLAAALSIRIDSHKDHRLDPAQAILISCSFDLSLDGVVEHQLQIQVLKARRLLGEEGEEVAPIFLGTAVHIGMVWDSEVPSKVSYTSKSLRWDHDLQELEGDAVLPEFKRVGAVESFNRL